eukprot:g45119.t1
MHSTCTTLGAHGADFQYPNRTRSFFLVSLSRLCRTLGAHSYRNRHALTSRTTNSPSHRNCAVVITAGAVATTTLVAWEAEPLLYAFLDSIGFTVLKHTITEAQLGPEAGSFAAWWQSTMPYVAEGDLFAKLQFVSMGELAANEVDWSLLFGTAGTASFLSALCAAVDGIIPWSKLEAAHTRGSLGETKISAHEICRLFSTLNPGVQKCDKSTVTEYVSKAGKEAKSIANQAGKAIESGAKATINGAVDVTSKAIDGAANAANKAGDAIGNAVNGASNVANQAGNAVESAAKATVNEATDIAHKAGDSIENAAKATVDGAKEASKQAGTAVESAAKATVDGATNAANKAGDAIGNAAETTVNGAADVANKAGDAVESVAKATAEGTKDVANKAGDAIGSAASTECVHAMLIILCRDACI